MAKSVKGGSTDVTTYFVMRLTTNGQAATGLTATDFDLQYTRSGAAAAAKVDATLNANGVGGAHSASTVIEVDATSSPGLYRVDWVDAAFAAGVPEVELAVKVATAYTEHKEVAIDPPVNVASVDTDAIDAAALKADAIAEIADAVWDETATGHVDAGKAGQQLWTDIDAILVDTAEIGAAGAGLTAVTLGATGLDAITTSDPAGVASTFAQMVVQTWRYFFKKTTLNVTQLKTYADDDTAANTTSTVSDDGTTQTKGTAS